jgi:hypothetical protein
MEGRARDAVLEARLRCPGEGRRPRREALVEVTGAPAEGEDLLARDLERRHRLRG